MSRVLASRLCRALPLSLSEQGTQYCRAPRSAAPVVSQRSLATDDSERHGNIGDSAPTQVPLEEGKGGAAAAGPADDVAARRRAELLKRYGDRSASSGPIAVEKDDSVGEAAKDSAADAKRSAADEADHNKIWGDYVRYMEHQRKKGWKT